MRILLENGARHDIVDDVDTSPLEMAKNMLENLAWTYKGRGGRSHVEDMKQMLSMVINLWRELPWNIEAMKHR